MTCFSFCLSKEIVIFAEFSTNPRTERHCLGIREDLEIFGRKPHDIMRL